MSPAETERAVRLRLAAELVDDRRALGRLSDAIASLLVPASDERGEWMRGLSLAFEVERYYTAVESTLARLLRTIDGDVPSGADSHKDILRAAAVTVPGLRPALVPSTVTADLRELVRFRDLALHGYDVEPNLTRMVQHAERVGVVQPELNRALAEVERWLQAPGLA